MKVSDFTEIFNMSMFVFFWISTVIIFDPTLAKASQLMYSAIASISFVVIATNLSIQETIMTFTIQKPCY